QAEDGIRDFHVTGVQTCALPILNIDQEARGYSNINLKEKEIIKVIQQYPDVIQAAAANYSPALVANYIYDLVREFNSFYQNVPILATDDEAAKAFRVRLSKAVGELIKNAFGLLGIQVPDRM